MRSGSVWRRVAAAAVLAAGLGLDLGAQSYNEIGSGGPVVVVSGQRYFVLAAS